MHANVNKTFQLTEVVYHVQGQTGWFTVWVGLGKKQVSILGKFRSGLVLTICRNPYHLPKTLYDSDG